jgi:hypothetical protein
LGLQSSTPSSNTEHPLTIQCRSRYSLPELVSHDTSALNLSLIRPRCLEFDFPHDGIGERPLLRGGPDVRFSLRQTIYLPFIGTRSSPQKVACLHCSQRIRKLQPLKVDARNDGTETANGGRRCLWRHLLKPVYQRL